MKFKSLLLTAALAASVATAHAQYSQLANQIPSLLSPALSGSLNYKGFLEAGYTAGVGDNQASILDVSTVQGFRYSTWFFMGVGAGVDVLFSRTDNGINPDDYPQYNDYWTHSSNTTAVMLPLFSDFRFNIGGMASPSFFVDIRVGASFLLGNDYVRLNHGYITNREFFYLKPSLGVRIPVDRSKPNHAFNIGVTYQLLTSEYWSLGSRNTTLSSVGANISYEW